MMKEKIINIMELYSIVDGWYDDEKTISDVKVVMNDGVVYQGEVLPSMVLAPYYMKNARPTHFFHNLL